MPPAYCCNGLESAQCGDRTLLDFLSLLRTVVQTFAAGVTNAVASCNEIQPNELEKQLVAKSGRELTAREKFYLALSEVCAPTNGISPEEDIAKIEATAREEQARIKCGLQRTVRISEQSQSKH